MGPVMILLSCPAYWWWERSPNGSDSSYFCYVNSGGIAIGYYANSASGVCFGFHKESGPT
jgi:hypothetical protein